MMPESEPDLPQAMRELADNVLLLFKEHVELVRAELRRDFRTALGSTLALIAALMLVGVGYLLLVAGGTLLLADVMAPELACFTMAGAHLAAGGLALVWARSRAASIGR
jgi:Putative Actinobacterial Holin-X, holin superfamily III